MKRSADDEPGGIKKLRAHGEAVFHGVVGSMDAKGTSIDCPEMKRQSGKAVSASNELIRESLAGPGDTVAFSMTWTSQGPKAAAPMLRIGCGGGGAFALLGKFRTGAAGYGFVSCEVLTQFFGRDAHVERCLAETFEPGQTVCFNVSINAQGMPMVSEMSACLPNWQPNPSELPMELQGSPEEPAADDHSHSDESETGLDAEEAAADDVGVSMGSAVPAPVVVKPRRPPKRQEEWQDWPESWRPPAGAGGGGRKMPGQRGRKPPGQRSRAAWEGTWSGSISQATGVIKSFNERNNYGFIKSQEVADIYGRDTFAHGKQLKGLYVGEAVHFKVFLGPKGQPQAYDVVSQNQWWPKKKHWTSWGPVSGEACEAQAVQQKASSHLVPPRGARGRRNDASHVGNTAAWQGTQPVGQSILVGLVTSYFPDKRCGFIECEEVRKTYGQEVYVFQDVLEQSLAGPGDLVAFYLHLSKAQKAQASHPMLRLKSGAEGWFALKGRFQACRGVAEIECEETLRFFGCHVSVSPDLASQLEVGSFVAFNAITHIHDGYPVAYNAEPCDEAWCPAATELSLAPEPHRSKAKWKSKDRGKGGHPILTQESAILLGRVKSFDAANHFGFIESDLVSSAFGCDALLEAEEFQAARLQLGDVVLFEVTLTDEQPRACNVQRCSI